MHRYTIFEIRKYHLVHMPAHIYQRVGRYADSSAANERAILADEDYIAQCRAQGMYPLTYFPHNIHFLWSAATMEGRSKTAIEAARKTARQIPKEALADTPILQGFLVVPYYALIRFGEWQQILREPRPGYNSPFLSGVWRYARGMAYAGLGQFDSASSELKELRRITGSPAGRCKTQQLAVLKRKRRPGPPPQSGKKRLTG